MRRAVQFVKKPRRVRRPQAANRVKLFSAGACTWQKIPLTQRASQRPKAARREAECYPLLKKVLALF